MRKQPYLSDNFNTEISSTDLFEHFDPSINHKTRVALKSGKLVANKIIDLHGCYLSEAKEIFLTELENSYDNGIKILLFIHGKGQLANSAPVLKTAIYHWAQEHPLILGFCSAPKKHGGGGATIIYLKTNRFKQN